MSREQVIARTFAVLDRSLKRASIAQIGGFRPPESSLTAWFGGRFVGRTDDAWPCTDGLPMLPLLQVRVDELPYIPPQLNGIALFNIFIHPKKLPIDFPAKPGAGWLLRSYTSLDGLQILPGEPESHLLPFPLRWSLSETDAPQWEDAWDVADMTEFNELPDSTDLFYERYKRCYSTKVGGWPSYIQSSMGMCDSFVFQIDSEEKPGWMLGDNGTCYFYRKVDQWLMSWDCF